MSSHVKSKRDRHGRQKKGRDESNDFSLEEIEYMAKRALKKASSAAKKLKTQSVSGYSNDSNPFGDSNLTETFVWRKKIEEDVHNGASLDDFSLKAERRRRKEARAEVEKIKKTREERAVEKARHEEDMALLARERARAEFQDWEKKEEEFTFDQSKIRSKMRLRQGRAKPIDILYKYLYGLKDDMNIELSEPNMVFKGLNVKDLEELHNDIKIYLDFDRETQTHVQYWEALNVICDWELAEARKRDALDQLQLLAAQERGLHASVEADVRNCLDGKTHEELVELQLEIESKLRSGEAKVVEYWEAILKRIDIYKANAFLKEAHAEMLRRHVQVNHGLAEASEEEVNDMNLSDVVAEEAGSFSQELMHGDEEEEASDPEEDRLRKPKYINRVQTGYEWNKYNQTHYDHDNPPPKFVQGYKFNIFYPDLVDKNESPSYDFVKDGTSTETILMRFKAGPPYEDIVFRIVDKEWEFSHKKGFKNTFDGGVLRLYFNFKRLRYRR
ncbi:Splicing factor Cactin [Cardamine amara subsp. amara]|uniref:Splicing factor Cactin n=1 Tax=Cardamine amara subsp. amara TaxID=228776 RepID=A0ABD0Z8B1_CARAN